MNSVINPTVPFNVQIPGGVQPGKMIRVQGFVPYASKRFAVNLLSGAMGNVVLHISPNFDRKCVVRNTIQNMQMGYEEASGLMPIQPGQNFEIIILCDPQNFKIAFNGNHFTEFNHRLPYSAVTNLAVDGQVVIHAVNYEQNMNAGRDIGMVVPPNPGYGANYGHPGNYGPPGGQTVPPYPPSGGGVPYQNYSGPPNPGYPPQSGYGHVNPPYPQNTGGQHGIYPTNGGYPTHNQSYPHSPTSHKSTGFLDKAGMAVAGALGASALLGGGKKNVLGALGQKLGSAVATATGLTDQLNPKKALKKQAKAQKKALKYGLPIAGAGIGAYALSKGLRKGFHGFGRSSSSSSSSSD